MKNSKTVVRILACLMAFAIAAGLILPVFAEDAAVIHIRTARDWEKLAQDCRLDSFSDGVTVLLENDLELDGGTAIPTFGGVFDGQGYTIRGFTLTTEGDHQGLFRYLRKGGAIRNLKLFAVVAPAGDSSVIGGFVGDNAGTVTQCRMSGVVRGIGSVGGIVGVNEPDGQIISCTTAAGSVSGEHFTGGIVGENYGSVVRCSNYAQINTQAVELTPQLEEFDWSQPNSTENLPACTDTGGIAGFSGGLLQSCTNTGTVGYPHLGYNVGGIAGRQTGHVNTCTNSGLVQGRKDVGGVVGQAEPYTSLRYQEDVLQKLTGELHELSGVINGMLDGADDPRHTVSAQLSAINGLTGQAQHHVSSLLDDVEELGDGMVDTVNDLSARVSRIIDSAYPIADDLSDASDELIGSMMRLEDILTELEDAAPGQLEGMQEVRDALDRAENGLKRQNAALRSFSAAMEMLLHALGDENASAQAMEEVYDSLSAFAKATEEVTSAAYDITAALQRLPGWDDRSELADAVYDLQYAVSDMEEAAHSMEAAVSQLRAAESREQKQEAMRLMGDSLSAMAQNGARVWKALDGVRRTIGRSGLLPERVEEMLEELDSGLGSIIDASDHINSAFSGLGDLLYEQSRLPPLQFPKLSGSFHEKENELGSTLEELNQHMESINQSANQAGDAVFGGMRDLTEQFSVIIGLLERAGQDTDRDLVVDVSEEEILSATLGKLQNCRNTGRVEGDVNVGGVTGSMAIEFDFDPEDDVTDQGSSSVRFQYLTRAIVQDGVNEGEVIARKDYAGGVVGRMDLGVALGCKNYGEVKSTAGEYIGGIAGASYAVIRDSWAKCTLTGAKHVGGIAGFGTEIGSCRSQVEIRDASCYYGAIAGECDGALTENSFVSDTLGGVDGISYAGKAYPISYEALLGQGGTPSSFHQLKLTFVADGQVIREVAAEYGKPVPEQDIPPVPVRKGFSGRWSDFDRDCLRFDATVEAIYNPWRTAVTSADGTVLAEGTFLPETTVIAESITDAYSGVKGEVCGSWRVSLENSESPFIAVRVRLPEDCRRAQLWQKQDSGEWKQLPTAQEGSYLRAEVIGTEAQLCLTQSGSGSLWWIVCCAGAAGLLVIVLLICRCKKKKNRKKAEASGQKPEESQTQE